RVGDAGLAGRARGVVGADHPELDPADSLASALVHSRRLLDPAAAGVEAELEDADHGRTGLLREADRVVAEVVEMPVRPGDHVHRAVVETLRDLRVVLDERIERHPRALRRLDQERGMAEPRDSSPEALLARHAHLSAATLRQSTSGRSAATNASRPLR